jgi:hypothetical protein
MTTELKIAIENLYLTFSIYPFQSTMNGCPCCVSDIDKKNIHVKQLRDLNEEDLSKYAFKAMTTWGDLADFKHFLPRIFELLTTTNFPVDNQIVLGKLEYGNWHEWPEAEIASIRQFLLAWWSDFTKHNKTFDLGLFTEIYSYTNNIDTLLTDWKISLSDNSFPLFVDLIYHYYNDLVNNQREFKAFDEIAIEKLQEWIKKNAFILETGFFHFTELDKEFATEISAANYIYEVTRPK